MNIKQILNFIPCVLIIAFTGMTANAQEDAARAHVQEEAMSWINNDMLISGIKAQNAQNASIGQANIDAKDKEWRAEVKNGGGAMTSAVLANGVSGYLKGIRDNSQGLYTEIFAMDNKGLNVGQSDLTSDYWQGDEAKWQKTFQAGAGAIHVSDVEFDESSQTYQIQVSVAISDPASGEVVGAITIGINAEML
ncbi:hypothetical protein [Emcibacter sp.]|uniref:hypothetical protein n=1 Tax=Emcibacter sp. TaxID=1979954 RepID=UPI002AA7638C|nr:hypothetical protein [Emcibacter sp.]